MSLVKAIAACCLLLLLQPAKALEVFSFHLLAESGVSIGQGSVRFDTVPQDGRYDWGNAQQVGSFDGTGPIVGSRLLGADVSMTIASTCSLSSCSLVVGNWTFSSAVYLLWNSMGFSAYVSDGVVNSLSLEAQRYDYFYSQDDYYELTADIGITSAGNFVYTDYKNGDNPFSIRETGTISFDRVSAIPEPETYALLLAGLALIGANVRRKTRVR